jgi:signal transduction histidine kinase/CheY-like chemotaxis protein
MKKLAKLIPIVALVAALTMMLGGIVLIVYRTGATREQAITEASIQAEILASSVTAAVVFNDPPAAQEYLNALRADVEIDIAAVYDQGGAIVAGYAREGVEPPPISLKPKEPRDHPDRFSIVRPLEFQGATVGYVLLEKIKERLGQTISRSIFLSLLVFLAALVVAVLALGQRSLANVNRELDARARELADANKNLVRQIEEREKAEASLRQAQRLEAVGQLTSGVAHDFNNLLTIILGNLNLLERQIAKLPGVGERISRQIANIRTAGQRGASLTSQLLAFSRRQALKPKPVNLNEAIGQLGDLLRSTIGGSVHVETALSSGLWKALVDPTQIELVIVNLAINARDAMEVGGKLTITTANVTLEGPAGRPEEPNPGDYVMLCVADTGTGMSEEVLSRAFEPFFTTKAPGKGSGLGLAQVFGFAKQSGGGIRIETQIGVGTTVKVFLPRALIEAEPAESQAVQQVMASKSDARRVLLVDDDQAVREVTTSILEGLGYEVVGAASGVEALEIIDREGARIDLAILDYAMPGMNGAQVASEIRKRRVRLPIIFVTGFVHMEALGEIGAETVIQKPFTEQDLARRIPAVLSAASALQPPAHAKA